MNSIFGEANSYERQRHQTRQELLPHQVRTSARSSYRQAPLPHGDRAGTRKQAETELAKRITELSEGRYVPPSVETVETYATHWIENIAPASRAAVTVKRYETLLRTHIIPCIGHIELQKLDGTAIDRFYASRRGLAPLTLANVHALLGQILGAIVRSNLNTA